MLQLKRGRRDDAGAPAGRFLAARFKRVLFTEGEVPPPPWTAPDPVPPPHPPDSPDAALGSIRVALLYPSRSALPESLGSIRVARLYPSRSALSESLVSFLVVSKPLASCQSIRVNLYPLSPSVSTVYPCQTFRINLSVSVSPRQSLRVSLFMPVYPCQFIPFSLSTSVYPCQSLRVSLSLSV